MGELSPSEAAEQGKSSKSGNTEARRFQGSRVHLASDWPQDSPRNTAAAHPVGPIGLLDCWSGSRAQFYMLLLGGGVPSLRETEALPRFCWRQGPLIFPEKTPCSCHFLSQGQKEVE